MRAWVLRAPAALLSLTLGAAGLAWAATPLPMASAADTAIPVSWSDASRRIITDVDTARLDTGEVLYDMKPVDSESVWGQTIGVVNAPPERCFQIAADYDHYKDVMPFTVESRALRRFTVGAGADPGTAGVDFFTRVSVFSIETRYVLRVAHVKDDAAHVYRTWWTLVDPPSAGCTDGEGRPCANDLATNVGSHRFEPYQGDPKRTLHTYTVRVDGKSFFQKKALDYFGGSSMRDVTKAIRKAAEGSPAP